MKNISLSKTFLVAGIALLAIWLLLDKCKSKSPSHVGDLAIVKEQRRLRDSAFNAQAKKDEQYKIDSTRWKQAADSASEKLNAINQKLIKTQATAAELAKEVKAASDNKDTSNLLVKCPELADKVTELNTQVDQYKAQVDSLTRAKDSLQEVTQKKLDEKEDILNTLRKSIDDADRKYSSLESDYKKAAKKADKKYSIGIGATAGITTMGAPGGAIGITISRTVLRF